MPESTVKVKLNLFAKKGDVCAVLKVTDLPRLFVEAVRVCGCLGSALGNQIILGKEFDISVLSKLFTNEVPELNFLFSRIDAQLAVFLGDFKPDEFEGFVSAVLDCREDQIRRNPRLAHDLILKELATVSGKYCDNPGRASLAKQAAIIFINKIELQRKVASLKRCITNCLSKMNCKSKKKNKSQVNQIPQLLVEITEKVGMISGFINQKLAVLFLVDTPMGWLSERDLAVAKAIKEIRNGASVSHATDRLYLGF